MYVAVSLLNHGCIFVGSTVLFIEILSETCRNAHAHYNLHYYWVCPQASCSQLTIKLAAVTYSIALELQGASYVRSHGRSSCGKNAISCKCSPSALCTALFSTNRVSNQLINLMIDHACDATIGKKKKKKKKSYSA